MLIMQIIYNWCYVQKFLCKIYLFFGDNLTLPLCNKKCAKKKKRLRKKNHEIESIRKCNTVGKMPLKFCNGII